MDRNEAVDGRVVCRKLWSWAIAVDDDGDGAGVGMRQRKLDRVAKGET